MMSWTPLPVAVPPVLVATIRPPAVFSYWVF